MTTSEDYTCGTCGGNLDITTDYASDPDLGDHIEIAAHCDTCQDTRVTELDSAVYGNRIANLASFVGSS